MHIADLPFLALGLALAIFGWFAGIWNHITSWLESAPTNGSLVTLAMVVFWATNRAADRVIRSVDRRAEEIRIQFMMVEQRRE